MSSVLIIALFLRYTTSALDEDVVNLILLMQTICNFQRHNSGKSGPGKASYLPITGAMTLYQNDGIVKVFLFQALEFIWILINKMLSLSTGNWTFIASLCQSFCTAKWSKPVNTSDICPFTFNFHLTEHSFSDYSQLWPFADNFSFFIAKSDSMSNIKLGSEFLLVH